MFVGNRIKYFEIEPKPDIENNEPLLECNLVELIKKSFNYEDKSTFETSEKIINMFYSTTKWHLIVNEIKPQIIQISNSNVLSSMDQKLKDMCFQIFKKMHSHILPINYIVRQHVYSVDMSIGTAFSPLTTESSILEYSKTFFNLINLLFLIIKLFSNSSESPFFIPKEIKNTISQIFINLEQSDLENSLEPLLLNLSLLLFTQEKELIENRNDIVVVKLIIIMSYDVQNDSFLKTNLLTRLLAQVIFAARLVIIFSIQKKKIEFDKGLSFCKAGKNTPIAALWDLKNLAHKDVKSNPSSTKISWSSDNKFTQLTIGETKLSLNDLKSFVGILIAECKSSFFEKLMMNLRCPKFDLEKFYDNRDNVDTKYSFLNDNRNSYILDNQQYLLHEIVKSKKLHSKYVLKYDCDKIYWNETNIRKWFNHCGRFVKNLICLIHIITGQPARASEMETYTIRNQQTQKRSLYIYEKTSCIIQYYHKTRNQTGTDRHIPRFLSKELHKLMMEYLIFVRPLEFYWAEYLDSTESKSIYLNYLFVINGVICNSDLICQVFRDKFQKVLKKDLLFSEYRHVCIGFSRHLIKLEPIKLASCIDFLPVDEQAVHSKRTGESIYAVSSTSIITAEDYHKYWMVSVFWQQLLGLSSDINLSSFSNTNEQLNRNLHSNETKVINNIYNISTSNITNFKNSDTKLR